MSMGLTLEQTLKAAMRWGSEFRSFDYPVHSISIKAGNFGANAVVEIVLHDKVEDKEWYQSLTFTVPLDKLLITDAALSHIISIKQMNEGEDF